MTCLGQAAPEGQFATAGERRPFLAGLFDATVSAADSARLAGGFLPLPVPGRAVVVGAGKVSAAVAAAFEAAWAAVPLRAWS